MIAKEKRESREGKKDKKQFYKIQNPSFYFFYTARAQEALTNHCP
jgi:hypothetical protein